MAQQRTLFKDYAATQRSRIENDEKRIQEVTALHLKCMEKDSQFFPQNPSALLPNFSPSGTYRIVSYIITLRVGLVVVVDA
jgi:hypothetical protein